MRRCELSFRSGVGFAAIAVLWLMAFVVTDPKPCQAEGQSRHGSHKQKPPVVFVFYKLLETNETGGPEPFSDGFAYWYGKGTFIGSRKVYDLKVTLPFDKKFPGFGKNGQPAPMNITPTEMTYEISRNGKLVSQTTFTGWANLADSSFFLHDGNVSPREGWPNAYPPKACPNPAPSGFSFTHSYSNANVRMYGVIKSIWAGAPNPCTSTGARGPKFVCGVVVFPRS